MLYIHAFGEINDYILEINHTTYTFLRSYDTKSLGINVVQFDVLAINSHLFHFLKG